MSDTALALTVALDNPGNWGSGCVAWVDSRDAQCGRSRVSGLLCTRHHNVATKRFAAEVAKRSAADATRAEHRAAKLPEWKAELAKVNADIAREDPPRPSDPAAYTGNVHPAIQKKRQRLMSDAKVKKMGALVRRAQELERLIGND